MRLPAARFVGASVGERYLSSISPITPESVSIETAPRVMRAIWGRQTGAMTLGTRIFVDPSLIEKGGSGLAALLKHEMVHARQWLDLGAIRFLLRYVRQYSLGRLTGASHRDAYLAIDLESEARELAKL